MKYYEARIYVSYKKFPLCTALFESEHSMNTFIDSMKADSTDHFVQLGNFIFKTGDVRYVEIREKEIKR